MANPPTPHDSVETQDHTLGDYRERFQGGDSEDSGSQTNSLSKFRTRKAERALRKIRVQRAPLPLGTAGARGAGHTVWTPAHFTV